MSRSCTRGADQAASWVGCVAWTCQPPTPTPPSAAARPALERPPTYPHLRKNSAACGGVYLPTPLGSEGKSVSLGIPLEKECSPGGMVPVVLEADMVAAETGPGPARCA